VTTEKLHACLWPVLQANVLSISDIAAATRRFAPMIGMAEVAERAVAGDACGPAARCGPAQ